MSVTPGEIGALAIVFLCVCVFFCLWGNRLTLTVLHPQLASSRGFSVARTQTLFTVAIAVVVTLAISWVGLLIINSLLVLPAASARNISRNMKQYFIISVVLALFAGLSGIVLSYYWGASAGASISLVLSGAFGITFALRKK